MRKFASICITLLSLFAAFTLNAGTAQAINYNNYEPWYNSEAQSKCITPEGNGTANGTVLTVWSCTGSTMQNFIVTGNNEIRHQASGKCVTPRGDAYDTNGAVLTLWTCSSAISQKFQSYLATKAQFSDKCVTSKGGSLSNGVWMTLWTCDFIGGPPIEQSWV
ncbi:RICIN domain-containing protein [Streptomyces sp. NPDC098101]|uniref:RICIN domain-containing protein n=1 Tax=Streptomyces sp. NPDC098101 TaxID=3366096 RepID=UPI00381E38BD